jgi:hypothetical protein
MKKLQVWAVALSTALLFSVLPAAAVESGGVGGKPANPQANNPRTQSIFIYELKHGQQATDGVRIFNNTAKEQTVSVYPVDSVLSSGGAFACAQAADAKKDVGAWVVMDQSSITLAPYSNDQIAFTITVPQNADVGEHDGCIAMQAASATAQPGQSGVALSFRSAIRMVVTVPGKIVKKLNINNVKVTSAKDGKYQVTPTVQNDGNVSLDTSLQVKLESVFGAISTSSKSSYPVLPHTKASWNFVLKPSMWGGFYRAKVIAAYNANPATELGVNQSANQATQQGVSGLFFAMPSLLGGVIELIILLLIVAVILWLIRKKRHTKHVQQHWVEYTAKKSDTIQKLAKEKEVSWQKIAKVNKLKPPYDLQKGQKLKLPPQK